uniref:Putative methyltransferase n=1 Tax=Neospora caninum (strain Liverpool) TaxID=572307 RepID=A0A0F7U5H3_NEOCL|nr:TPA: Putative methyltransferase [Neospora caninum Liverpool]
MELVASSAEEAGAFSAMRREKIEDLIDDFLYAARAGEMEDLKTSLAALKEEFQEPHSLCRFRAETENKNKKPKTDKKAAACGCERDGKRVQVVDLTDPFTGQTALHMAAANGEEEIARYLIVEEGKFSCALHLPNNMGNTPLHWAVTNQRLPLVKLLLASSPPPTEESSPSTSSSASSPHSYVESPSASSSSSASASSPATRVAGQFVVDVLAQNTVGKSALSEGFNAGNMEILQLLLEHHSAKALEDTYQPVPQAAGEDGDAASEAGKRTADAEASVVSGEFREATPAGAPSPQAACAASSCLAQEVVHAIRLGNYTKRQPKQEKETEGGQLTGNTGVDSAQHETKERGDEDENVVIKCREIGLTWTGEAFGENAARDDTTGLHLWSAAVIGAQWMAELSKQGRFSGASVLELGAGCGLMGLAAALHAREPLARFYQSDIFPHTLRNLEHGFLANGFERESGDTWTKAGRVRRAGICALDWTARETWPHAAGEESPKREDAEQESEKKTETLQQFDFLLGSDLIYDRKMLSPLVDVVASLLRKPAGTFYYVHRLHRQGAGEFVDALRRRGLKCEERSPPEEYFSNPFVDKTKAEAELHLPEFSSGDFVMVRCAWR